MLSAFSADNTDTHDCLDFPTFSRGHSLTRSCEDGTETNGLTGRSKGYSLKDGGQSSVSAATYGYDTAGRLSTVSDGTDTFSYGYEANSNLLATLNAPQHTVAYSYEPNRDLMTVIENKTRGATLLSSYAYTHDALGRRSDRTQSGSAINTASTDDFSYNSRSEVVGSANSIEAAANWNPTFTYDKIGNRIGSVGVSPNAYTANELNQYTAIDSTNPVYDLDGNLTSDGGTWTYTWNNENRLASATDGATTIDFTYDYQGRLVKKDDGTNVEVYVYDGWNRIATFTEDPSSVLIHSSSNLWGLDLSGSIQGAGGVGGLLKEGNLYPIYDANGNIMQKLDGTGTAVMSVDYDPFGNIISGTLVGEYGFSTKPLVDDLDWYYYGFRYYDPVTGRWPNRDPIGEYGGFNLYAMVGNDTLNMVDLYGLSCTIKLYFGHGGDERNIVGDIFNESVNRAQGDINTIENRNKQYEVVKDKKGLDGNPTTNKNDCTAYGYGSCAPDRANDMLRDIYPDHALLPPGALDEFTNDGLGRADPSIGFAGNAIMSDQACNAMAKMWKIAVNKAGEFNKECCDKVLITMDCSTRKLPVPTYDSSGNIKGWRLGKSAKQACPKMCGKSETITPST
ncbi:RHS repeat-associated core domain-containing protein [Coraliomargarita sp. SDUM461003]|uniref:RHS repeat-associated core domain-containing protein n=1 Tax=Thalassobacterium maritimum TaxID=3041265 RepID=A0ABU1AXM7_9BACT|nr:RHS repeat-associated core domain-containing protein [Coraliomargarita sp. SDUM461003]MDQ8208863.1 RHS repeat-associated core domain-containing protein [Coraliomargarita sp. SDUM461003]